MRRYKLTIEYDGSEFVGWQRQENGPSVQAALEAAVLSFSGEEVVLHSAGRTDTGVHALGMVGHFDLETPQEADTVRDAINYHLGGASVCVLATEIVDEEFHARFSARQRAYRYRIVNRRPPLTLDRGRAWRVKVPLDAAAMAKAAEVLIGFHDFTSFRSVNCQAKSPEKTMDSIIVSRQGEDIFFDLRARSFLHNQVRIIVGTLKQVGEGRWAPKDVAAALAARDRAAAGMTAPPEGLYFVEAVY